MKFRTTLALGAAAAAALIALPAAAANGADAPRRSLASADCFSSRDWTDWSSPSPDVIYLKVRNRDVYRIDLLAGGQRSLEAPGKYLVNTQHGSQRVCSPVDLDLKLGDLAGFVTPLFPQAITRLTPAEVAALPRKARP
jgi:hypothetical protein